MADGKGLEIFQFEFTLPKSTVSCPNCGYRICGSILDKVTVPRTIVLICCGSVIYWNFTNNNRLISSLISTAKDIIQNGLMAIITSLSSSPVIEASSSSSTSTTTKQSFNQSNTTNNVVNQYYQCTSNSIHNQLVVNNNNNNNENDAQHDSTDFSSLNLSTLSSIGAGTLAKLDNMLDEVAEIKMYVKDSCNELKLFNANGDQQSISLSQISNRRVSDGELTLPSLEWDLNDVHFDDDSIIHNNNDDDYYDNDSEYAEPNFPKNPRFTNNFNINHDNFIDYETLSEIIFNKDFELKDERFFRMKKQFVNMKQRLKFISKTQARQHQQQQQQHNSSNNINSFNYRTNRDSAFFEDLQ